jgi:hypothetical protein
MKAPKHFTHHDIASLKGNLLARDILTQCEDKSVSQRYAIWDQYLKQLTSMENLDDARDGFAQAMAERVVPPSTRISVVGRGRVRAASILTTKGHHACYCKSSLQVIEYGTNKRISISLGPKDLLEMAGRLITLGKYLSKSDML